MIHVSMRDTGAMLPFGKPGASAAAVIAERLAHARGASDGLFTRVGTQLQGCAAMLGAMGNAVATLPRELESEDLVDATARVASLGDRVAGLISASTRERGATTGLLDAVIEVGGPVADLERNVRLIGILALNAHVVAADAERGDGGLKTIADNASQLAENAALSIGRFRLLYRQLTEIVSDAVREQASFAQRHGAALNGIGMGIVQKLLTLERQRTTAVDGLAETGRLASAVSQGLVEAVMALQIGDATHQRMIHVEAGLQALDKLGEGSGCPAATAGQSGGSNAVPHLLGALLDDAAVHLDRDGQALIASIQGLTVRAEAIPENSRALYGSPGDGPTALAQLGGEVQQSIDLLRSFQHERQRLDAMVERVHSTVGTLLAEAIAVRDIERNMAVLSLNATAQCAHRGPEARGFNVIAQQLRKITTDLVGAADAATRGIETAEVLTNAFVASAALAAADQVDTLGSDAGFALGLLAGSEKRLRDALDVLAQEGPRAVRALRSAGSDFADSRELVIQLRQRAEECVDMELSQDDADGMATVIEGLWASYTMASEREVHDAVVPIGDAVRPAAPPREELEQVEFF